MSQERFAGQDPDEIRRHSADDRNKRDEFNWQTASDLISWLRELFEHEGEASILRPGFFEVDGVNFSGNTRGRMFIVSPLKNLKTNWSFELDKEPGEKEPWPGLKAKDADNLTDHNLDTIRELSNYVMSRSLE